LSKKEIINKKIDDIVISIDPGREKCGVAVVKRPNVVLYKAIVCTEELADVVSALKMQHGAITVVLGNGTSSSGMHKKLQELDKVLEIVSINEYRTTDMARLRYWEENPPRGWRRLVPVTMQVVPVPVDDYAAVILAEKYFGDNR
jgi:RNase H-fold protein (predicted Holliday junction resolvase)